MKLHRGDVVVCAIQGDYGKPRPAVVIQSDLFNPTHASITLCPITSDLLDASMIRVPLKPSKANGLKISSQVMVDKVVSLPRDKIRQVVGKASLRELKEIETALKGWLGL